MSASASGSEATAETRVLVQDHPNPTLELLGLEHSSSWGSRKGQMLEGGDPKPDPVKRVMRGTIGWGSRPRPALQFSVSQ